jgi:uncharacterized iron-regulated membrane protein
MSNPSTKALSSTKGLDYRTVWRWHFYAGLFCIPFVLWLSVTGTIFLFHPQIQHWLDRPYDHLSITQPATANAQVQAALAAVPGSALDSYELPHSSTSTAQILVDKGSEQFRVYVQPQTLAILHVDNEDYRIDTFTSRLHGELLLGKYGSWIVELAASWAVVMILTGLFLWWPRDAKGLGGVLYPRLRQGGRAFWKDIHAVVGIYVSFFALLLLLTGLPWAKGWGGYLKAIRHFSAGHMVKQDWTTSSADLRTARSQRSAAVESDMGNMAMMHNMDMSGVHRTDDRSNPDAVQHAGHAGSWGRRSTSLTGPDAFIAIDKMIATVQTLGLANPVLVSPPMRAGGNWTAKSDTRDRPLRVELVLDGKTGAIVSRSNFNSKPWLDRVIGTGIAAHEGQLFGFANQLVSFFTTACLFILSISGYIMWWRRRPVETLGAPVANRQVRFSTGLVALMIALGIYFPSLGGSMIVVVLVEQLVLKRAPGVQKWLGLSGASV